jgi:hypothetical protein
MIGYRHLFAAGLGLAALGAGASAQAGFLDDLARAFGARPAAPVYRAAPDDPLSVTVRPRHRKPSAPAPYVASRPTPPVVDLDPQTDPDWYLKDPTLRRGDIVVTSRGVQVYRGRDSDAIRRTDFTALVGGRERAKPWQQQLQAAAQGGRVFFGYSSASVREAKAPAAGQASR